MILRVFLALFIACSSTALLAVDKDDENAAVPNFYTSSKSEPSKDAVLPKRSKNQEHPDKRTESGAPSKEKSRNIRKVEDPSPTPVAKKDVAKSETKRSSDSWTDAKPHVAAASGISAHYPLDPFGLARAFGERWDFSHFLISAKEETMFRTRAIQRHLSTLTRAFGHLSDQATTRQRNLANATIAAYLLSRDESCYSPLAGVSLSGPQLLAVRNTMQRDSAALGRSLKHYEVLRHSIDNVARDEDHVPESGQSADNTDRYSITIANSDIAARETNHALAARLLPVDALLAVLAAENLTGEQDQRETLAAFAPPPPDELPVNSPKSTLPLPMPGSPKTEGQPEGENVKPPEHPTVVVFPASINAPVLTPEKGIVDYAGEFRGYGRMVVIEHTKGLFSVYAYLGNVEVRERQTIETGAMVGRAGIIPSLGSPGVYYQVRKGATPIDPSLLLGKKPPRSVLVR